MKVAKIAGRNGGIIDVTKTHDCVPMESTITAKSMVYISNDIDDFYLSNSKMMELGLLHKDLLISRCALTTDFSTDVSSETTPIDQFNLSGFTRVDH